MNQDSRVSEDDNSERIKGPSEVNTESRLWLSSEESSCRDGPKKTCVNQEDDRHGDFIHRHSYPQHDTTKRNLHTDYHKNTPFKGATRRSPTPDFKDEERQQRYNKRKSEDGFDNPAVKTKRMDKKCTDLIVLGLPWKSTEDELRYYFSQFGDLIMVQVKKDLLTGQSKGYGFIRFQEYESQEKCLSVRHMIDGRWCDVRIPNSKERTPTNRVFVDRITEQMTRDDLSNYFSKFGEVTHVFIPVKPFKAFAFVTFSDPDVAQSVCDKYHTVDNVSVHVSCALPKSVENHQNSNGNFGRYKYESNYISSYHQDGGRNLASRNRTRNMNGRSMNFGNRYSRDCSITRAPDF